MFNWFVHIAEIQRINELSTVLILSEIGIDMT